MSQLKHTSLPFAITQINSTIGDFEANFLTIQSQILAATQNLPPQQDHLILFPEACLTGYPLHDLVELNYFFTQQDLYIKKIQSLLSPQSHLVLGAIVPNPKKPGRPFLNAALYITHKKIKIMAKTLLPTWDVFNEERYFEPGQFKNNIIKINSYKILVTICEDIWGWDIPELQQIYTHNPLKSFQQKVDLVVNLSASPFTTHKEKQRLAVTREVTKKFKCPMLYCNRIGAEDELIFDGQSFILDKMGQLIYQAPAFKSHIGFGTLMPKKIIKIQSQASTKNKLQTSIEKTKQALVTGLREFCHKNKFQNVHLGISGGIDSAVVACLATEALGHQYIQGLALPSPFSSPLSLRLAQDLSKNLNIQLAEIPFHDLYFTTKKLVDTQFNISEFATVHENIQARLRGLLLMAYSNQYPSLLLGTSNKSELAVGYSTLYGDMNAGLLPIGDLYKTQVYEVANWYQKHHGWITPEMIHRPPTAELRPNQTDQDSLPPYKDLDKALRNLIEGESLKVNTKIQALALNLMFKSEFKRWQAAPILKVSTRSFGRGRHWPLSHRLKI